MSRYLSAAFMALALCAPSAIGQEVDDIDAATDAATQPAVSAPATDSPTTDTRADDDEGFDLGWVGLAGLAGLLGLLRRDPDTSRGHAVHTEHQRTNR
jgi:hypothetical protein